jgi:transposase-like protein
VQLVIDRAAADRNSRVTGIRLATLMTRLMEQWRLGRHDAENALIIVAVIAITSEKLIRAGLRPNERSLEEYLPLSRLQGCNVSSIAAATGVNRETVRRRVRRLIDEGSLIRTDAGEIALPPERVNDETALTLVRRQLEALTRFMNETLRDGAVVAE